MAVIPGKKPAGRAHAVGLKPANPFGLHDVHGNVREWCQDWYEARWYENSPAADPTGPFTGSNRVFRGGGWYTYHPSSCRSALRYGTAQGHRSHKLGFRVALSPPGQ